jgi:hypothetical protein
VSWWLAEYDIIYVLFLGVVRVQRRSKGWIREKKLEQTAESSNQTENREIQFVRE